MDGIPKLIPDLLMLLQYVLMKDIKDQLPIPVLIMGPNAEKLTFAVEILST